MCWQEANSAPDIATPTVIFRDAIASVQQSAAAPDGLSAAQQVSMLPVAKESGSPCIGALEDAKAIASRCDAICALLRKQRVPFELQPSGDGDGSGAAVIVVLGCLSISAPYTYDSCQCGNETVLGRFKQLIAPLS